MLIYHRHLVLSLRSLLNNKKTSSYLKELRQTMSSNNRPRVFVSRRIPEKARALLSGGECDVTVWDSDEPPPRQDFLQAVKENDGLFCLLTDNIDAELLTAAGPQLKVVSTMSVGYDHIDLKECSARNIMVGYTPGILTNATAELTVALLLATSRRLKEGMLAVETGKWGVWKPTWLCGPGLEDSTVGIVGLGRIGMAIAKRLQPFGVAKFLYSGRSEKPEATEVGALYTSFSDLLEKSDFVLCCCSLTPETKEMFNKDAFKQMKKSAVFVNMSRGGTVHQGDLYEALKCGQIGAAGLDVTTPEPLPTTSPLLTLPNCIVIPHMGSSTHAAREAMAILAAKNLLAGVKGQPLVCQVK